MTISRFPERTFLLMFFFIQKVVDSADDRGSGIKSEQMDWYTVDKSK